MKQQCYNFEDSNIKGNYKEQLALVVIKSQGELKNAIAINNKKSDRLFINLNPISNKKNDFDPRILSRKK